MNEKDKKLLLIDLSGRLPYGVICKWEHEGFSGGGVLKDLDHVEALNGYRYWDCYFEGESDDIPIEIVKPYLRPMSSMTEEEKRELEGVVSLSLNGNNEEDGEWCLYDKTGIKNLIGGARFYFDEEYKVYDWLNTHHFDYRGLTEKNLALEAPEGMYNF